MFCLKQLLFVAVLLHPPTITFPLDIQIGNCLKSTKNLIYLDKESTHPELDSVHFKLTCDQIKAKYFMNKLDLLSLLPILGDGLDLQMTFKSNSATFNI